MKGKEIPPNITPEGDLELFHGTKNRFDRFETPTRQEIMDVMQGGVVYFTSDIATAKRYAGEDGYIATVHIKEPVSYEEQRNKQGLPKKASEIYKKCICCFTDRRKYF